MPRQTDVAQRPGLSQPLTLATPWQKVGIPSRRADKHIQATASRLTSPHFEMLHIGSQDFTADACRGQHYQDVGQVIAWPYGAPKTYVASDHAPSPGPVVGSWHEQPIATDSLTR